MLPDPLHFILETPVVGISLFHANEMQDREHIVGDTPVHTPQIGDIRHFRQRYAKPIENRRLDVIGRCLFAQSR